MNARHVARFLLPALLSGCSDDLPVDRQAILGELTAAEAERVCRYVPDNANQATGTKRQDCTRRGMVNSRSVEECRAFVDRCLGKSNVAPSTSAVQGEYLQSGPTSYGAPYKSACEGVDYEGCTVTFGEYADCLRETIDGIASANRAASCDRVRGSDDGPLTDLPVADLGACDAVARGCPQASPYPTEFQN